MGADDTVMLITPMFHGSAWGLPQAAVYAAAKVVLPGRYMAEDTSILVDEMVAEGVTVANGAPAIFDPMLRYIRTLDGKPDFRRTRLLSGATEPSLWLMKGFAEETGADIIHAYGATETTPLVTVNYGVKATIADSISEEEKWDLKRSQGLLVNGIDIKVVDSDGNELPHDGTSQGEVLMRGRGSPRATTSLSTTATSSPTDGGAAVTPERSAPPGISNSPTALKTWSRAVANGSLRSTWKMR